MMLASFQRCLSFSFNAKCLNDVGAVTCLVLDPASEANVRWQTAKTRQVSSSARGDGSFFVHGSCCWPLNKSSGCVNELKKIIGNTATNIICHTWGGRFC